jgi:hypothetical protein
MKFLLRSIALMAVVAFGMAGEAKAEGNFVLGVLSCDKSGPGTTYFFYSRIPVICSYQGSGGPQKYMGTRGILFGVDLEMEASSGIGYFVVGGAWKDKDGLAGYYVGAQASATVGAGAAAQAGLAGVGNGFVLIPFGIGGQTGVGFTGGLGYLNIDGAM